MKRLDVDLFQLSTGRTFETNKGIIGLAPDDLDVYSGYDLTITMDDSVLQIPGMDDWTLEEKHELANFMIERWRDWKMKVR